MTNIGERLGSFAFAGDAADGHHLADGHPDHRTVQGPALTIEKSSTTTERHRPPARSSPTGTLVTNTGNVTLTGLALVDDNTNARDRVRAPTTLGPDPAARPARAIYTVTQADLDAGGTSTNTVTRHDHARAPTRHRHPGPSRSTQSPALTLDKTITSTTRTTRSATSISYSYLVTNTGNVTLSGRSP